MSVVFHFACIEPIFRLVHWLNYILLTRRAKNIQNKATINVDPHSKLVNSLRDQVVSFLYKVTLLYLTLILPALLSLLEDGFGWRVVATFQSRRWKS